METDTLILLLSVAGLSLALFGIFAWMISSALTLKCATVVPSTCEKLTINESGPSSFPFLSFGLSHFRNMKHPLL